MKCIVSLSGGRDSATCLGLAVDKYGAENVYAMGFEYGSTHPQELECAKKIAQYYEVPYQIVKIEPDIFKGSTCTMLKGSEKEIQKGKTYEEILKEKEGKVDTYVPFRNGLFSAYVAARAESLVQEFNEDVVIMLGQHADDSGYYVDENGVEHLDETKAAYPDAVRKGSNILMADGFTKKIEDVQIGDKIWSFNENTRGLEAATVLNNIYKGVKITYNAFNDLWVSENHIMWLAKRAAFNRFAPFSTLKRKSAIYKIPTIPYYTNNLITDQSVYDKGYLHGFIDGDGWISFNNGNPHINACQKYPEVLEEIIKLWKNVYTPDEDIQINYKNTPYDYKMSYICLGGKTVFSKFATDYLLENIDFCRGYLNGIMIAEGWCVYNKASHGNNWAFCQNTVKNIEVVDRIDKCINALNLKPITWIDNKNCKNWKFTNYLTFPLKYGSVKKEQLINNLCRKYTTIALKSEKLNTINTAAMQEAPCYDLTTTSGSFIADGVLVHNCSTKFVRAFEEVVKISSVGHVHYEAPFVKNHKWELIKRGLELKKPVPYELCLSCYDPIVKEDGTVEECRECATCLDVKSATKKALENLKETNRVLFDELIKKDYYKKYLD